MAQDFGNGVSRTLSAAGRQYQIVVWQASKPPLDSELNLVAQVDWERASETIRAQAHSGFLLDPLVADTDFVTAQNWSNWFRLGRPASGASAPILWANVNGWVLPVTGTNIATLTPTNRINLFPAPESSSRIDMVFLEVWLAQIAPNPSTANKPAADTIWKYGNVMFGATNETDDMEDPTIGFETTERLQLQYRIRVAGQGPAGGTSVDLSTFPDGLDDPNMLAQGAADDPQAGITWTNMKHELGDPGLWRAGNGDPTNDLNTVDGYSYAIPICAVFRRNSSAYVSLTSAGNPNQNGALDRNPVTATITDPAEAARTFATVTLTSDLAADDGATAAAVVQVVNMDGSGFDNSNINWASTFLTIGDEIVGIDSVDITTSPATITITMGGRGRYGTQAAYHPAGTPLAFYCFRPDGRFADQISEDDILDLRRSITLGEWDYDQLLAHNLGKLIQGDLRTSYKQSGISDTEGSMILEVDSLFAGSSVPNQTEHLDGPDGIRTAFSDAVTVQHDVTLLLSPGSSDGPITTYVSGNAWEVGAGFVPAGYQTAAGWNNGTVIDLFIGGSDGSDGARATARGEKFVRFATPWEQWRSKWWSTERPEQGAQHPVTMTFIGDDTSDSGGDQYTPDNVGYWSDPAEENTSVLEHPGPMAPLEFTNFIWPFLFLGGVVNDLLHDSSVTVESTGTSGGTYPEIVFSGADFDTAGVFYSTRTENSVLGFADSPMTVSQPLFHGGRTLWSMLTNNGHDLTGTSSQLYVVVRGDTTNVGNNGVWRVIGAGTGTGSGKPTILENYTSCSATASDRVVVEQVSVGGLADFVDATGLEAGIRSQYTHTEDGLSSTSPAAACVVITDLEGTLGDTANPWGSVNLGGAGPIAQPITCDMVLTLGLVYGPGRGGTARVGDLIDRFGMVGAGSSYLRQSPAAIDSAFPSEAGVPDDQTFFPIQNIQTWNRLSSLGLHAPTAPAYGGARAVFSEMERESELFVDPGSKTVLFRPFQSRAMTLVQRETDHTLIPVTYTAGYNVDGASIFLTGAASYSRGYPLPPAYMPRFGRQDIPFYIDTTELGTGSFLAGINHLFHDSATDSDGVFNMMGGNTNSGSAGVNFIFAQTIATATTGLGYAEWGNVPGGTPYADDNGYQARLYEDVNAISSDIPRGLRGIQLPPFLGVARLIAIYDERDWDGIGAYDTDRVTPISGVNTPVNLLRTDADKQTLYIVQGGASDFTGDDDDHTYVIPDNVIDITRSPDWTSGESFEDLEYIVQFECFGFSRGFINKNNYVLAREFDGEGDAPDAVLGGSLGVGMIIPAAADYASSAQAFVTYRRTVYQGDPYMTRDGETRVVSDYEHRYGQVLQSDAVYVGTPIQQFDSTDDYSQVPVKVNERTLEVLAYADFWTTLGTGKMGGFVHPGTVTDVGHLTSTSSRIPGATDDPPWQPDPRTFTQRQTMAAPRSSITIEIYDYTALADTVGPGPALGTSVWIEGKGKWAQFIAQGLVTSAGGFLAGTSNDATAQALHDTMQLSAPTTMSNPLINGVGVRSIYSGGNTVRLEFRHPGDAGNEVQVYVTRGPASDSTRYTNGIRLVEPPQVAFSSSGSPSTYPSTSRQNPHAPLYAGLNLNRTNLLGGVDLPVNGSANESAGSPVKITGLTERLPLGILVQDSDFIGEDPLRDGSSALRVTAGVAGLATSIESPQILAEEYSRPIGAGSYIGMSDGGILRYAAYDMNTEPTGTRKFRIYRGASIYSLDPLNVGGPVDWATHGMPKGITPVLKGAILVGRAFLVRNYEETAFTAADTVSHGDEVQMVIATRTLYGQGPNCVGYSLTGEISPTGYGKGYSSSDRYRLEGKPFVPGHSKTGPDPDVELAPYPNEDPAEECVCP